MEYAQAAVRCVTNEVECLWEWASNKETHIVDAPAGKMRGYKRGESASFRGIPFGESISGAWRWKAPRKAAKFEGVQDCKDYAPCAPQDFKGYVLHVSSHSALYTIYEVVMQIICWILFGEKWKGCEDDCLALNVFAPWDHLTAKEPKKKLPVMVYIHGGIFEIGGSGPPIVRGERFPEHDCVLVTANYRLGVLGFLNVPGCDTNRGLRDQLLALEWVRHNIDKFGGDPENVTIFGESAGGMACANLMSSPHRFIEEDGEKKPLFHKSICMSGAAHNVHSKQKSEQLYREFMRLLPRGTTREDLDTIKCHYLIEAQDLYLLYQRIAYTSNHAMDIIGLSPHIDDDVLPQHPLQAVRDGFTKDVRLLTGTTKDEFLLFSTAFLWFIRLTDWLPGRVEAWFPSVESETRKRILDVYQTSQYAQNFVGMGHHRLYNAAATDWVFRIPCERLASAHSEAGGVSQVYRYDHPTLWGSYFGACHGADMPMIFGTNRHMPFALGVHDSVEQTGAFMRSTWVSFARGDLCLEKWPVFHSNTRRVMALAVGSGAEMDLLESPDDECIRAWGDLSEFDFVHA
eukprot:TRINITY_DN1831_c0_g1_i1.p1 TRINITY_DN1831_c0_g1~~TRINITY_DN1831_c0_g1_i1.p1  ORF type:complete len:597 (+),score=257.04 TRINITY_DN1831_c0_g1_i1:77-1792(+)